MDSQDLVVRQPPQIGGFEDTQEELDWYGSNPEGIDRNGPPPQSSDDDMALLQDDSDPSDGEWSRPIYSDASRSPLPSSNTLSTSHHPPVKRKATTSLDKQEVAKKGIKRSKHTLAVASEVASTMGLGG